jgi:transposase
MTASGGIFVGIDSAKARNAVAVAEGGREGEVRYLGEFDNTPDASAKLIRKLASRYETLHICYEAGPTGYGLYRQMLALGHDCVVVAPSLIPRRPGDRVKTNRRDALSLARLLRAGELTAVWVPDETHEAVRDLVRTRAMAVEDYRRKRQHVTSFLLRHGRSYEGKTSWRGQHKRWLDGQNFIHPAQRLAFQEMIAHVVVSKFADSLPLYRQAQMLERQGIKLDRSTLAGWVGRACWWLTPLYDLMLGTVLASPKVFADDTTLPVLDPGRGRTKTGRLWCYAVDDRPWCGPGHPIAAYVYSDDRKNERPAGHLAGFRGVLQVDGYDGFKKLAGDRADASVRLAFCWTLMRRYFYEFYVSTKSPLAGEVLARVRQLYAIEAEVRSHPAEHRQQVRQARSRPIVEALHVWLQDQVGRVSRASDLAKAIRYAIRHWPGLVVFLDDGRVEMDTNVVERAIRPNTLTRKNALFAGSDGGARHWALAMTLIQTAKTKWHRSDGLAHRRARAHRLRTNQEP